VVADTVATVGMLQGELELGGMPKRLVRVTPSKLSAWTDCPRRYRMTYLPPPGGAVRGVCACGVPRAPGISC